MLITERGRSAAVLLDLETYDDLQRRIELLEGLVRGERAFAEGRVVTSAKSRSPRRAR